MNMKKIKTARQMSHRTSDAGSITKLTVKYDVMLAVLWVSHLDGNGMERTVKMLFQKSFSIPRTGKNESSSGF